MTFRRGVESRRMTPVVSNAAVSAAAVRPNGVAWTPSSVVVTIGFVVTSGVTHSDAAIDTDRATPKNCQA